VQGHRLLDFGDFRAVGGFDAARLGAVANGAAGAGGRLDACRLEAWGEVVLVRPDARASGPCHLAAGAWRAADAAFEGRIGQGGVGGGRWRTARPLPDRWPIEHAGLQFLVGLAPSGHTGLFPEQAAHWIWMAEALRTTTSESSAPPTRDQSDPPPGSADPPEVLNLFAYTGGASVALAMAGARVTHVDASRPAIGWARENAALNGVTTIRWIHEDARRFVDREQRRGRRYDGLLLDPPAFGRGPAGDWKLDRDLGGLLEAAVALLRPDPAFVLLNVYTGDQEAGDLDRLLAWALDTRPDLGGLGPIQADTLMLSTADGRQLPTGIFARVRRSPPASTGDNLTVIQP
jgi:23S rRNA (cytosine1962-C5)-methyltransferase